MSKRAPEPVAVESPYEALANQIGDQLVDVTNRYLDDEGTQSVLAVLAGHLLALVSLLRTAPRERPREIDALQILAELTLERLAKLLKQSDAVH